jgi:dimethylhistidine N-methyltransferase
MPIPIATQSPANLGLIDLHPPVSDFQAEVLAGLRATPKSVPAKFLYDQAGSQLFEAICELPEYYLTRTEMAILATAAPQIAHYLADCLLIEFGSGSSRKIRLLLDAAPHLPTYMAVDISQQHLHTSCQQLAQAYPHLSVLAVCADYTQPLALPPLPVLARRRIAFFPGSSVGNFEPAELRAFLRNTAALVGSTGGLLIGVDLKKDRTRLEPAYDDAQGISADFALNLLGRINREMNANFEPDQFRYTAFYNETAGRIEMRLVSQREQTVTIAGQSFNFQAGEPLATENSYKFSLEEFGAIARAEGFIVQQVWTDPEALFSVQYLRCTGRQPEDSEPPFLPVVRR